MPVLVGNNENCGKKLIRLCVLVDKESLFACKSFKD